MNDRYLIDINILLSCFFCKFSSREKLKTNIFLIIIFIYFLWIFFNIYEIEEPNQSSEPDKYPL